MPIRTRTRGEIIPDSATKVLETINCQDAHSITNTDYAPTQSGFLEVTTDFVTPNWNAKRESGAIVINPFFSVKKTATGSHGGELNMTQSGSCASGTSWKLYRSTGVPALSLWSEFEYPYIDTSQLMILAGTQAAAGIVPPDVYGMVELAELSKTLDMLRNPFKHVNEFIDRMYRDYKRNCRRRKHCIYGSFASFIAGEWLRYRYGIMPLCLTIDGILSSTDVGGRPPRITSRGSSFDATGDTVNTTTPGNPSNRHTKMEYSIEASARAGVLYEHSFEHGQRWGFRLSDVPLSAWELVPNSFIADWFINIGDFIAARTPKAGVHVLGSWTTTLTKEVSRTTVTFEPLPSSVYTITDSRTVVQELVAETKQRHPGIQVGLAFEPITFKRPKDWIHLADLAALIGRRLLGQSS